jgi:hypothetical protein
MHCPPSALSVPVQMKAHLSLSIARHMLGHTFTMMATWINIAHNVTQVRVVQPALDIRHPFQVGKQSATESTSGCISPFLS